MSTLLEITQEQHPEDVFKLTKSYKDGVGREFRETLVEDYYSTKDGQIAKILFDDGSRTPNRFSIVKPETDRYGSTRISDAQKKHYPLSRLVYSAWSPNKINQDFHIAHKDLNPQNNHIDNLLQLSKEENINFQRDNGVYAKNSTKQCKVLNKTTGLIIEYDSIKSFLIDINAPEYIIRRVDTASLSKLSKFKHLEIIKD